MAKAKAWSVAICREKFGDPEKSKYFDMAVRDNLIEVKVTRLDENTRSRDFGISDKQMQEVISELEDGRRFGDISVNGLIRFPKEHDRDDDAPAMKVMALVMGIPGAGEMGNLP